MRSLLVVLLLLALADAARPLSDVTAVSSVWFPEAAYSFENAVYFAGGENL